MTKEDTPPSKRLEEMGFETRNVILNLGSMFYFVMILHFLVIIVYFIKKCRKRCKNMLSKKIDKTFSIKKLMNNLFLLYFESTVEVLVAIYLNLD